MIPYGSVLENMDDVKNLLLKKDKGIEFLAARFKEWEKLAEEKGNWTWQAAGCVCGVLIMFVSFLSFFSHFLSLRPSTAILSVYTFCFGFVFCVLEYKEQLLFTSALNKIR